MHLCFCLKEIFVHPPLCLLVATVWCFIRQKTSSQTIKARRCLLMWLISPHQTVIQSPSSVCLADEKRPKEAAFLVHVHSRGVGHSDEQTIAAAEREQPPLVGRMQRKLGSSGPAGSSAGLHQQDGNWVGAHLTGEGQVSEWGAHAVLMGRM